MSLLHIGAGTVYLLGGWVNVDLPTDRCHLAADRPDLVDRYGTAEQDYYSRHRDMGTLGDFAKGPRADEYVCDRFGSWQHLPCRPWGASMVLGRQTFEHLSAAEACQALEEVRRVLIPGGILRLSVPDHEGALKALLAGGDATLVRHLLGPRNGPGGYHMQSYSREALDALVRSFGFAPGVDEESPHCYPSVCLRWVRL